MVALLVFVTAMVGAGVSVWTYFGEYWRQWKDMRDE